MAAIGCGLLAVPAAHAQRPALSRPLERALDHDTSVTVWLFARPAFPLDRITAFVRSEGGTVRRTSRWLHAVSAELGTAALVAAGARADLQRIQPVRRFRRRALEPVPTPAPLLAVRATAQDSAYGPSAMPFRQLNLFPIVERGAQGAGIRIAVFDTGFETELLPLMDATLAAQYDFVFNDSIVRNEPGDDITASRHGTQVWSLLAANVPDTLIGIVPAATFLLAKTEDVRSETPLEEDNFVAALEWADSVGVDIVTASIGYTTFDDGSGYAPEDLDGDVAVTTVASDMAAERGIMVITSAGNNGPAASTLNTPADGDSVAAVGAEDSLGVLAAFSSRGPTADGRIKPDLTAPGVAVWVLTPVGGGHGFDRANGTSFSAPIIAGAAALVREFHPGFGLIDVLDALRESAEAREAPDNARGWGRPDVALAVTFPRGLQLAAPSGPLLKSVTPEFRWSAADVPAFAQPVAYRVRLAADTSFATLLLDSTLTDTSLTLPFALLPGEAFVAEVVATAADSQTLRVRTDSVFTAPAWVELQNLNEPFGLTIREFRPRFEWRAPQVAEPPGPFVFTIEIIRVTGGQPEITADSLLVPTFTPTRDLERNTPYRWRVTAFLADDSVTVESEGTFVIVDDSAPPITTLFQNFPNPFPNSAVGQTATCIWFDLAVEGVVRLDLMDLRGHVVRTLIPNADLGLFLRPGRYGRADGQTNGPCDPRFEWDGTDAAGNPVPAGIYLVKLNTPEGAFFKRIVFLGAN